MRILNCRLTKSDTNIIGPFGKKKDGTWHTGCDVEADTVYSICNGVILAIQSDRTGRKVVTVQFDGDRIVRYGNLTSTYSSVGSIIEDGQTVGYADKSVHFEFCKKSAKDTKFPVRVGRHTYYKVDPTNLLTYNEFLRKNIDSAKQKAYYTHPNPLGLSPEIFDEMNNGKG